MAAEAKIPPDPVDQIMDVMEAAFDPVFGEAWNRRQICDALTLRNCHYALLDSNRARPEEHEAAAGFILSRQVVEEEEVLLIAVRPEFRRRGIASALLDNLVQDGRSRRVTRLFLEMREGNPAEQLYVKYGFRPIGRRPNYYNRGEIVGIDAITFALSI